MTTPLPQGREIHDIHCAGGTRYAVGAGGMILKRAIGMGQGPPLDDGSAFSMFPNPANSTVTFVHDMGAPLRNARITVRDALGREVARLPLGAQDRTVWDTRGIPPGPYLVELHAEEGRIAVQRLVLSPQGTEGKERSAPSHPDTFAAGGKKAATRAHHRTADAYLCT